MKNFLLLFLTVFASVAQKDKIFPSLQGTMLSGKPHRIPEMNGKFTIVGIAFNRKAEDELRKWLNPLYYTFIKRPDKKGQFDVAEIYDVNFVFIPMISGFKKIAEDFKNSTDSQFWDYIMDTEKTDIRQIQEKLGITDGKIPYFFVLDNKGKIVEMVSGEFAESKIEKLEEAVE